MTAADLLTGLLQHGKDHRAFALFMCGCALVGVLVLDRVANRRDDR